MKRWLSVAIGLAAFGCDGAAPAEPDAGPASGDCVEASYEAARIAFEVQQRHTSCATDADCVMVPFEASCPDVPALHQFCMQAIAAASREAYEAELAAALDAEFCPSTPPCSSAPLCLEQVAVCDAGVCEAVTPPRCPDVASRCPPGCAGMTASPYDEDGACIEPAEVVLCQETPGGGTPDASCVQRVMDGAAFVATSGSPFLASPDWQPCDAELSAAVLAAPSCER